MTCEAELCPNWTGQGCICEALDLSRAGRCAECDEPIGPDDAAMSLDMTGERIHVDCWNAP